MQGPRIGDIVRRFPPLTPDDTLARAVEVLRSAPPNVIPIVAEDRLAGVVGLSTLAEVSQLVLEGNTSAEELRAVRLGDGFISPVRPLVADGTLREAAEALQESESALPVVDASGRYVGMLSQADLAGALYRRQRPPTLGGMATPLGVYLTTGTLSAGARGSVGLFLTGVVMATGFMVAWVLTGYLMLLLERAVGIPLRATLASLPVGFWNLNPYDIWRHLPPLFIGVIFALLLHLSPLAGLHAAEHQVVHALERDRPLTFEQVAQMPRVHPRCGTRLVAILVLATLFGAVLPISDPDVRMAAAVGAVLLWWRPFGMWLQEWVTTRPASPRQIRSAIAAAETLLAQHRRLPHQKPTAWRRIWHMGIVQVLTGGAVAQTLLTELATRWHLPIGW